MIDWQALTNALRSHYKPLTQVASEVGMDWQHVERLARGEVAEPRFNSGVKLLDLAYDVLPEDQFEKCRQ